MVKLVHLQHFQVFVPIRIIWNNLLVSLIIHTQIISPIAPIDLITIAQLQHLENKSWTLLNIILPTDQHNFSSGKESPPSLHRMLQSTIIANINVFHQLWRCLIPRYPRVWCPAGGGRDSAMAAFHWCWMFPRLAQPPPAPRTLQSADTPRQYLQFTPSPHFNTRKYLYLYFWQLPPIYRIMNHRTYIYRSIELSWRESWSLFLYCHHVSRTHNYRELTRMRMYGQTCEPEHFQ